ncbi:MAG: 50S ribosomal protein L32e [Candidatus Aenigmatarchaeota archaeon]
MNPKKKPAFLRQEWFRHGNIRKKWLKWRMPRGNKSKLRRHFIGKGFIPSAGYGAPVETRMLHPSGLGEVMVNNPQELAGIDAGTQAVRIAGAVGGMKRMLIQKKAEELKLRVLNPRKIELRVKTKEKKETKGENKPEGPKEIKK